MGSNLLVTGCLLAAMLPAAIYSQHVCDFPPSWVAQFEAFGGSSANETATTILGPATSLLADDDGNLFLTCQSFSHPTYAPAATTLKLDRQGRLEWIAGATPYPPFSDGRANAITLDADGNAIVAGDSYFAGRQVYTTTKYASDGTQIWTDRFIHSCGNTVNTVPYSVGTDEAGCIYVSGNVGVVKYSSLSELLWASCGRYNRAVLRVLANGLGYYLASMTHGSVLALGVARFDTNGVALWATNLTFGPGTTDEDLNGSGIAVDTANNLCLAVASKQASNPGSVDIVAVKFALDGTHLWTRRYGATNRAEFTADFTVDAAGNFIVVGHSWNSPTPPQSQSDSSGLDILVLKYSPDGDVLWTANYGGFSGCQDLANSVSTDTQSNLYVMGVSQMIRDASLPRQAVVLKYSPDGRLLWRMRCQDFPWFLAVDSAGDVYAAGQRAFMSQFNITELLAMKLGQSEPRLAVCTGLEGGTFHGSLVSARGSAFEILSSTNFVDWTPFTTVVNESGLAPFYDPGAGPHPARYYRARRLAPEP